MNVSARSKLVVAVTLAFSQAAWAAVPPGAGAQMQQVRPPPARERLPPEIRPASEVFGSYAVDAN